MARPRRRKSGFSRIELLIVITTIVFLMSMIVPASQQVIGRTRLIRCGENLRNIASAMGTYASSHDGRLPPGVASCMDPSRQHITGSSQTGDVCPGRNWALAILQGLDEGRAAVGVVNCPKCGGKHCSNQMVDANKDQGNNVSVTTPQVFICPSAPWMTLAERFAGDGPQTWKPLSKGNYAANFGKGTLSDAIEYYPGGVDGEQRWRKLTMQGPFRVEHARQTGKENDGRFSSGWKSGHRTGIRITDGAQNTLMLSEVIGFDSRHDGRGAWASSLMGGAMFTGKSGPNADGLNDPSLYDRIQLCAENEIPKNNPLYCGKDAPNDGNVWAAARSGHPGGVNAITCANSVKFYSNSVDLEIWQALCTRSGDSQLESQLDLH